MLVLKVLGVIAIIIGIISVVGILNQKCMEKFQVPLFSKGTAGGIFIAAICLFAGMLWYQEALKSKGDTLNGIVLLALGGIITIGILISSYRKTDIIFGTLAAVIHIFLLVLMTYIGVPLFIIYIIGTLILIFSSKPVYVVNK
ncbi:hypothetical protein [Fusobacterium ulcerans]|uniref:hypothetical protein n=1 Tax=Fusobacterium ulcerans TaxID=861 RepID=UPI003FED91B5